jgi:hypothetical protein
MLIRVVEKCSLTDELRVAQVFGRDVGLIFPYPSTCTRSGLEDGYETPHFS